MPEYFVIYADPGMLLRRRPDKNGMTEVPNCVNGVAPMDAPPCDVLGCPKRACWTSPVPPPAYIEDCLCDVHMALLEMTHPEVASRFKEWTVFAAVNGDRISSPSTPDRTVRHRPARKPLGRGLETLFLGGRLEAHEKVAAG